MINFVTLFFFKGLLKSFGGNQAFGHRIDYYFIFEEPLLSEICFQTIIAKTEFTFLLKLRDTCNKETLRVSASQCLSNRST